MRSSPLEAWNPAARLREARAARELSTIHAAGSESASNAPRAATIFSARRGGGGGGGGGRRGGGGGARGWGRGARGPAGARRPEAAPSGSGGVGQTLTSA